MYKNGLSGCFSRTSACFSKHNFIKTMAAGILALHASAAGAVDAGFQGKFAKTWGAGYPGGKGHAPKVPVDACIVDLWDTSMSVTDERFALEREALAQALESKEFGGALKQLPHQQIAMHIAQFNDYAQPVTEGWVVVNDKSRFDLAGNIRNSQRFSQGFTVTDKAVNYALTRLEDCHSSQPVIDLVTDGTVNFRGCAKPYDCHAGLPLAMKARDEAAARGVTINVLAIQIDKNPELAQWARDYMATSGWDDQQVRGVSAGLKSPATPGKVFEIPNGMDYSNNTAWISQFSEMRKRKLIEEMAGAPRAQQPG